MSPADPWFEFTLGVLATWRLAHLLAHEDGPFDAVVRLRRRAGDGIFGRLMDCAYCLSLWIALPLALFLAGSGWRTLLWWLALSGGASAIEKLSAHKE